MLKWKLALLSAASGMTLTALAGCSTAVSMGVKMVGKAVDDEEATKMGDALIGQPASAADAKLGAPQDVLREIGGGRQWRIYPAPMNVLGNQRYVIQVQGGQITAVSKEEVDASGKAMAEKLYYDVKAKGKTPQEAEAALGLGPPIVAAVSRMTGQMVEFYQVPSLAGMSMSGPKLCRLKFDSSGHCTAVDIVDVGASTGSSSDL